MAGLAAAVVALVAIGCAPGPDTPTTSANAYEQDMRVEVQWRVGLATDRAWEIDPRELGRPIPASRGDLVVGASNGWVYRIDAHNGEIQWATPVGGSIDAAVRVVDNVAYVGTDTGDLVALDWREGSEQWRYETRSSVESRPTVEDGRVFVTDATDTLYGIDAVTGELLWDVQYESPEFFTIKGGGEPMVDDEVVYTGFSTGELVAMYADTGEEIWSVHLGDETGEFGDVDLPLIDRGDQVIATSHAGGVFAVEKASGALLWHHDVSDVAGIDFQQGWLFATTSTGQVFALDTREGEVGWAFELPEDRSGTDVGVVGPMVGVATARGPLYWLDLTSGQPMAKWAPSTGFQSAPVVSDDLAYVMSNRGYLYGIGVAL